MQVSDDKLILAGEVVESRMTAGALYILDERGLANYPGMLQALGLKWVIGQKVKITIERADPVGSNPVNSSASES